MALPQDATRNTGKIQAVLNTSPPNIENNDPVGNLANSMRVNQQQVLPTAIQNRFLAPVNQWPIPASNSIITNNDVKVATSVIGENGADVADFSFKFTNTTTTPVFVELCATLFIDGTDFENAYPFGAQVAPLDWIIERIKTAHFAPDFNSLNPQYNVNQSNQDSESFIVKFIGTPGEVHQLYLFYYWRSIANQGGVKNPSIGQ